MVRIICIYECSELNNLPPLKLKKYLIYLRPFVQDEIRIFDLHGLLEGDWHRKVSMKNSLFTMKEHQRIRRLKWFRKLKEIVNWDHPIRRELKVRRDPTSKGCLQGSGDNWKNANPYERSTRIRIKKLSRDPHKSIFNSL
uniref:Uncharacterized protein n=1 Tax=Opuntia streptacantha TaxID=393608 RepID=A0A7C8YWD5_OPUST